LRETNPDSTNPDGFDYGARIIAERTSMGLLAPYSNSEGICSTGARNKAAAKLYSNRKADEAAYVKPTRKLLRTIFNKMMSQKEKAQKPAFSFPLS